MKWKLPWKKQKREFLNLEAAKDWNSEILWDKNLKKMNAETLHSISCIMLYAS